MPARLRVTCTLGLWALGLATGCEGLLSIHNPVAGDGPAGDGSGTDSGGCVVGGLPPSSPILLSEVVLSPSQGEMIEIVNTSSEEVDLSTYYLSDSGNYYRLPVQPAVDTTDFIVRFPDGTRITGHGVMTIAIDTPTSFSSTYGRSPDFSVADQSMDRVMVNGTARLTDTGEPIILFQWDRCSDLVRDVDIMIVGNPSDANLLTNKSLVSQDGPDPDMQPTAYATDLRTIAAQATAPAGGRSTKRIALEDGHEMHNSTGNGQSGDDETTEDTSVTWDGTATKPFGAPTPGVPEPGLMR